jgi:RNA polymerase sigma factor (sigma-70 family)
MPFNDDVGDCEHDPHDMAETSVGPGTSVPEPVRDDPSGGSVDHSEIDPVTADRISRFVGEDWVRVVGLVGYVCGQDVDAPSAVSEALARYIETLARGRTVRSLVPWVTQVAINVGRSEMRHSRVRRRKLPSLVKAEGNADPSENVIESLDLQRAIAELPKRQAQVIALRYGLDMSIADIAEVLGISEGGTKASLSKARRNLAGALMLDEGVENE